MAQSEVVSADLQRLSGYPNVFAAESVFGDADRSMTTGEEAYGRVVD